MPKENGSKVPGLIGMAVAGTGLAHFARPGVFEGITKATFSGDIRQHTYTNGGIETALGLGLAVPKTRRLAVVGLLAYGAHLGANLASNR